MEQTGVKELHWHRHDVISSKAHNSGFNIFKTEKCAKYKDIFTSNRLFFLLFPESIIILAIFLDSNGVMSMPC